jgi:hypothetical protein
MGSPSLARMGLTTVFSGMDIDVAWVHVMMMSMSMVKDVTTSNRR